MLVGVSIVCMGQQNITDIASSDASYPAIKRSIEKGYFSLMDGTKFLPDQTVSRKELAILLDRMDALNSKASLSQSDAESLKKFSEQFKTYLESQQNEKGVVDSEVSQIKTEQKTINYDISLVEDHALRVEKKHKDQDINSWLGLGVGVLGLMK